MNESKNVGFDTANITALSHLYRGELYRSTVWRTRLDATTNWAVVTTGLALSLTFSSETASPLPLVLVGLLVAVFLLIEGRRYRFFDFFRIRAHILEVHFFGPILRGEGVRVDNGWNQTLYQDYRAPALHITFLEAIGRRKKAALQINNRPAIRGGQRFCVDAIVATGAGEQVPLQRRLRQQRLDRIGGNAVAHGMPRIPRALNVPP